MNKEDKKLQKHLVDEMMKVSKTNPDVMFYMEALMKYCIEIEQRIDKAKEYINNYEYERYCPSVYEKEKYIMREEEGKELLNILNGDDKSEN